MGVFPPFRIGWLLPNLPRRTPISRHRIFPETSHGRSIETGQKLSLSARLVGYLLRSIDLRLNDFSIGVAPLGRRYADRTPEGAAECGLGLIANAKRNLSDTNIALAQETASEVHAPTGQVLHGRLADVLHEALSERGT